jgi:hypothetical protein
MNLMLLQHHVLMLCLTWCGISAFTPSRNVKLLEKLLDSELESGAHVERVSETITHAEITRTGMIKSVAKYFIEKQKSQNNSSSRVSMHKLNEYVNNIKELYKDYLGETHFYKINSLCALDLDSFINSLSNSVASVDFDVTLKNLPHAHFDADTFSLSSEHVHNITIELLVDIAYKNYASARKKIGLVLHTTQDFYSHSNWIEMGKSEINKNIGSNYADSRQFGVELASDNRYVIDEKSTSTINCNENCTKHVLECSADLRGLHAISKELNLNLPIKCPIVYFKCDNNVIVSKLTSGYFSDDSDETLNKPVNKSKCSHGGFLDMTSFVSAIGGINKDSGYYFLSPHAHLHLKAAQLAIDHTEYFFDELRSKIGNNNFDELLQILHADTSKVACFFRKILFN